MKIGIDAQTLLRTDAGVTYYTKGILSEVLKLDKENFYDLLLFQNPLEKQRELFGKGDNRSSRYQKLFPYKLFYKLFKLGLPVPLEVFFGTHDLYFFPDYVEYPHLTGKSVVVVHDLSFADVPHLVQPANRKFLERFVPKSLKEADHVIAVSEFTKGRIKEVYGVVEEKITVAGPAVDTNVFYPRKEKEIEAVKRKYGIESSFILFLGSLEPRKNVRSLIEAFSLLKKNKEGLNLVLAGKPTWIKNELEKQVRELKLEEKVKFLGYVEEGDRPALLSAAEAFAYPSLYEGFGMPVLEAQGCGVPVVASNFTSLPEVAGEGAILVNPKDAGELADALTKALSSPQVRKDLIRKGNKNTKRFTWNNSSRKILAVFNSLGK